MEISALLEWCEAKKKRFKFLVLIRAYQALIEKQTIGIASAPRGPKWFYLVFLSGHFRSVLRVLVLAFTRDRPFTERLFNSLWLSESTPVLTLRVTCLQMSESRYCQFLFGSDPAECWWKSQLPAWHSCSHVMFSPCRPTPGRRVQRWPRGGWRMAALDFNYLISEWAGRATLAEPAQEPVLWGHQKEEGSETVSHAEEHKVSSSSRTERAWVTYGGENRISALCFWATLCHCWQTRWFFFSKILGFHQWE